MKTDLRTLLNYYRRRDLSPQDRDAVAKLVESNQVVAQWMARIKKAELSPLRSPDASDDLPHSVNQVARFLDGDVSGSDSKSIVQACAGSESQLAEIVRCHSIVTQLDENKLSPVASGLQQQLNGLLGEPIETPDESPANVAKSDRWKTVPATIEMDSNEPSLLEFAVDTKSMPAQASRNEPPAEDSPVAATPRKSGLRMVDWGLIAASVVVLLATGAGTWWLLADSFPESREVAQADTNETSGSGPNGPLPGQLPKAAADGSTALPSAESDPGDSDDDTQAAVPESAVTGKNFKSGGPDPASQVPSDSDQADSDALAGKSRRAIDTGAQPPNLDLKEMAKPVHEPGKDGSRDDIDERDEMAADKTVEVIRSVGRFSGKRQLLLSKTGEDEWRLTGVQNEIVTGTSLYAPDGSEPQIELSNGARATIFGPAEIVVSIGAGDDAAPEIRLLTGQVVIEADEAQTEIIFDSLNYRGTMAFLTAPAQIHIKNASDWNLGMPPRQARRRLELLGAAGRVQWKTDNRELEITPGKWFASDENQSLELAPPGEVAAWANRSVSSRDSLSTPFIAGAIGSDDMATAALHQLLLHNRVEVRTHAARILFGIGEFAPMMKSFDDSRNSSFWPSLIDSVRQQIYFAPESGQKFSAALGTMGYDETVFQSFIGHTPEQIVGGADQSLFEALSDARLPVRVLAFAELRRVTGKSHGYRPLSEETNRRKPVRLWKEMLDRGQIRSQNRGN